MFFSAAIRRSSSIAQQSLSLVELHKRYFESYKYNRCAKSSIGRGDTSRTVDTLRET